MLIGPSTMPAMLLSTVNMSAPPYALFTHHHRLLADLHLLQLDLVLDPGVGQPRAGL
jgi:hypothetical protein